jgi:hypothetical protein
VQPIKYSISQLQRQVYLKRNRICRVPGCAMPIRKGSLGGLCNGHRSADLRKGSPTQRIIRLPEIAGHLKDVERFIRANQGHPAVVEMVTYLQALLDGAARFQLPAKLKATDWKSRLQNELAALHDGHVTGAEMLAPVLATWLFSFYNPKALEPNSRPLRYALSRSVLLLRDGRPSSAGHTIALTTLANNISARVLDRFGEQLLMLKCL